MKSILFLTNAYPDFQASYRGIFIKKMASLMGHDGYSMTIVTPKIYRGSPYYEEQQGIKVYRFPFFAQNKLLIEYKKIPYLRMLIYFLNGFLLTVYAILKNRCRVIHVHWAIPTGLIGVLAGKLLKKPVVVTIHGSDLRMALENGSFFKKLFLFVCKNAVHLNCVSENQKKELEKMGIPECKIVTAPMGIEESFLKMGQERSVKKDQKEFLVLSNRNLLPIYNVSLLIYSIPFVLKKEPETKFLIAGEGAEKENLEQVVKNLNIASSVTFLGRIPHEKMPALLSEIDIYVSTSLYDGTSVSLLEAMGAGAFPIVTDIPANREWIINEENGFLVPEDNAELLASRIIEAIHNREMLKSCQAKNRSIVGKKALWPGHIEEIKNIYGKILNS